ncbi:hypothetical protein GCK32_006929 [Trichostrongylus colubriformis]|uniref:carnosine N-methyltransferase n=1 Tax=Trichostrongylus colubriformis TaxID=6319 RepID=A0AAN8FKF1_TRICO
MRGCWVCSKMTAEGKLRNASRQAEYNYILMMSIAMSGQMEVESARGKAEGFVRSRQFCHVHVVHAAQYLLTEMEVAGRRVSHYDDPSCGGRTAYVTDGDVPVDLVAAMNRNAQNRALITARGVSSFINDAFKRVGDEAAVDEEQRKSLADEEEEESVVDEQEQETASLSFEMVGFTGTSSIFSDSRDDFMTSCESSSATCNHCEGDEVKPYEDNDVDAEVREAEKILNAFLCYGLQLSSAHKDIILKSHNDHMRNVLRCVDCNQEVLKKIIGYGLSVFGEEFATKTKRIRQKRRPDPHYMAKVLSTLRQIVREWTVEGKPERDATYKPLLDVVRERYPCTSGRSSVKIMVPGSGLGRLAYELAKEGFTVEGNEFSMVMLMTSSFLLNACFEAEEHVIYPYVLDKSNSWSYGDQTRPVHFPDLGKSRTEAPPNFSMIAGDFLEVTQSRSSQFDCVVTAWFIDTAKNIIDYIETIYRILKPGGTWLNVGPLTYHYEDMIEELYFRFAMSFFHNVELLNGLVKHNDLLSSWSWSKFLSNLVKMDEKEKKLEEERRGTSENGNKRELVEDGRMWPYVVPVEAFAEHVFGEYTDKLVEGVVVEYVMKEYDEFMEHNVKGMWLAKIVKSLLRCSGSSVQYNRLTYVYMPPKFVADRWLSDGEEGLSKHIQSTMIPLQHARSLRRQFEDDRKRMLTDTKFKVNDRVELLDYNNSTRVRPARVKKVVGRRICVHVKEEDFDGDVDEDDRQFGEDSEFWVDQASFYLFHVGWACYNNYGLGSTKEYRKHAQKIAEALSKGDDPPFAPSDVTPAKLRSWNVSKGGYLRVGMDGPDVESECIPLHCTSPFMFPVGYAEKFDIKLGGPNGECRLDTEMFDWNDYLQQSGAIAAPESLFRPVPDEKYMDHFQIGAKLESSDMCENHLICPATVAAHKGRLLQIHFDGWEDSYDQLFDVHSSDIFPLGWCEMHGYKLEPPKIEEEPPKKKKKKT